MLKLLTLLQIIVLHDFFKYGYTLPPLSYLTNQP